LITQQIKYGNDDVLAQILSNVTEEQKMLTGFANKLKQ
jgi:hypothetical protein